MKKTIIVINGRGGCGKDTLCEIAAKRYAVRNVSSITPIKNLAAIGGWKGGKEPKDRKFLADLKALFTEYNDLPTNFILSEAREFSESSNEQIMFVHIREASEIAKFVSKAALIEKTVTLLIKRETQDYDNTALGNTSDDNVNDFSYDFVFINDAKDLETLEDSFNSFLKKHIV